MDFLDPKKRRAHTIRLIVGYVVLGIAILAGTVLLLYQAYGFGLNKGKIIQNGLVFVSSHPGGSSLYLNGKLKDTTNTRLVLEAGTYVMQVQRPDYHTWQRAVTVEGGSVSHFDYPFLFPSKLSTKSVQTYSAQPAVASQSPDRRWLLVQQPANFGSFDLYDLNNPQKAPINIALPASVLTSSEGTQSFTAMEWSNDNRHLLLTHTYDKGSEYVMLDRQDPSKSLNITKTLKLGPTVTITLQDKAYDKYFVHDTAALTLGTATLNDPTVVPLLDHVLAYKTYGTNVVLYATNQKAPTGRTNIMLYQNKKSYTVRTVNKDTTYLLNLTQYSGSWYVAVGAQSENRVYVYQDPVNVLQSHSNTVLVPVDVLKVQAPNYVSFSANAQFVMAENANQFAVYDVQYDKDYAYTIQAPFDAPQPHASWMDGNRIAYVSAGHLVVFDYDSTNKQTLQAMNPAVTPFFDQPYKFVYSLDITPATASVPAQWALSSTALLTPADQ